MRFLCLSGGGVKGAFQLGAIKRLIELDIEYDGFFGISVGAINAAKLAMHKTLAEGLDSLDDIWFTATTDDIKKSWMLGYLQSWWKRGVYSNEALKNLIRNNFDPQLVLESGKKLGVCTVSLESATFDIFTEADSNIEDAIIASAITPVFLNPHEMDNQTYIDGGIKHVVPVQAAIDAGATEVDVVVTEPKMLPYIPKFENLGDVGARVLSIMSNQMTNSDVELAIYKNPNVKINVIRPYKELGGGTLDMSLPTIVNQFNRGYEAAKNVMV